MQNLSLISLEPEPLPSFSEVMKEVESLMRLLYESLDVGATICRKFYDDFCDGDTPGGAFTRDDCARSGEALLGEKMVFASRS